MYLRFLFVPYSFLFFAHYVTKSRNHHHHSTTQHHYRSLIFDSICLHIYKYRYLISNVICVSTRQRWTQQDDDQVVIYVRHRGFTYSWSSLQSSKSMPITVTLIIMLVSWCDKFLTFHAKIFGSLLPHVCVPTASILNRSKMCSLFQVAKEYQLLRYIMMTYDVHNSTVTFMLKQKLSHEIFIARKCMQLDEGK